MTAGTIQRQGGLFGRRLAGDGAPAASPPKEQLPAGLPLGEPGPAAASAPLPARRRSGSVALILAGAAAVGVAGGWAIDRWSRPTCDPVLDPACVQSRSSSSSGGGSGGTRTGSAASRSSGSWFNWGDSAGSASPVAPSKAAQATTQRGGFGAIGRFFLERKLMQRLRIPERPHWRQRQEELGFTFHSVGGRYWVEDAAYQFGAGEIDVLEDATNALERACLEAVERVVHEKLFDRLHIDAAAAELATLSWRAKERNVVGRFDLQFDGTAPPKLYEYNADTPTALFEASVAQWHWFEDRRGFEETKIGGDQFNSIHERLIAAWKSYGLTQRLVHFTCDPESDEDRVTTEYLRDTCAQAGHATEFIAIADIGLRDRRFVDLADRRIEALFKLYPWEWLLQDDFGKQIAGAGTLFLEPAWKMILSNKGILAILWEMFPGHPNLLPASLDERAIQGAVVRKPLLSREGANVALREDGRTVETTGPYRGPFVYQAALPPPVFDGNHAVIGSWVIASQAAGIGIREDDGPITRDTSRFVPHYFR